jgi:iron complex outermembrane receptor protein
MDWQDVQSGSLVFAGGLAFSATFNGPSASGPGFDLNVIAEPVESLTLGASVSWNDLTFDADVGSGIGIAYRKGDRLSFSPKVTAGLWLDYMMALPASGYDLRFSASGNYVSERYQRLFGAAGPAFVNEPLTTASTRLTLETPNNWSLALFADNVTNEQSPITGFDPTGRSDSALRMRPRTVGIQVEFKY